MSTETSTETAKRCARHPDEAATGACERCAAAFCILCARGPLCLGCAVSQPARQGLGLGTVLLLAVVAGTAGGLGLVALRAPDVASSPQAGVSGPTTEPEPPAAERVARFAQAGIAVRGLPAGLRAVPYQGQQVHIMSGKQLLVRINSLPMLPWMSHQQIGRPSWEWRTGAVDVPERGLRLGQELDAWTLTRDPWLVMVKHGRFVVVSSKKPGLLDPSIRGVLEGIEILPGSDPRSQAVKERGLNPEQADGPPPEALLVELEEKAQELKDWKNRTQALNEGLEALAERRLSHGDALVLWGVVQDSLKLKAVQAVSEGNAVCPVDDSGEPVGPDGDDEQDDEQEPAPSSPFPPVR